MIDSRICSVCAWREQCKKRFSSKSDSLVHCPDYSRDVKIKNTDSRLVEYQLGKWQAEKREKGPNITISRETGSGGSEIARILARDLDMDLMGGQIISKVAESARMSSKVVETLDEKAMSNLDSWINSLFTSRHLWPDVYLRHLTKVIAAIGEHGNAVIVGRGAHFILAAESAFRIRFISPMEIRVRRIMRDRGISREEAKQYITKRDSDRASFARKYFNADMSDPSHYDLVLNTDALGIEKAAQSAKEAFLSWKSLRSSAGKPTSAHSEVPAR